MGKIAGPIYGNRTPTWRTRGLARNRCTYRPTDNELCSSTFNDSGAVLDHSTHSWSILASGPRMITEAVLIGPVALHEWFSRREGMLSPNCKLTAEIYVYAIPKQQNIDVYQTITNLVGALVVSRALIGSSMGRRTCFPKHNDLIN